MATATPIKQPRLWANVSPVTNGAQLARVRRRRARISCSPLKSTQTPQSLPRTPSMIFPQSQPKSPAAQYHLPTSALEFEEFSFWANDGSIVFANVTEGQRVALQTYLEEHYGALDFFYHEPFFVIGCEEDRLPPEDERPFTVAGLIAIWRKLGDMNFCCLIGYFAAGPPIKIDPEILAQISPREIFPDEVVLYMADFAFPDCYAVTILWETLVIELPQMSWEVFQARLEILPEEIEDCSISLRY